MAEPFAPLAPEGNVRFRPTEGVVDRTAVTALEGLSNVVSAGKSVFDSIMEDSATKAMKSFNVELRSIGMSASDGRISEHVKNKKVQKLLLDSMVANPDLRKEFEDSATAAFGNTFKENALAKKQEDVYLSFLERGSQVAGPNADGMTVDQLTKLGSEAIAMDEQLESLNKRISASKAQHELFGAVNKTNEIEVTNSARAVIAQLHKTTISPALQQIMSGQFSSPEEASQAKAQLAAGKAQAVAQARKIFADISVAGVFLDTTEQENMIKSIQSTYEAAAEMVDAPAEIRKGYMEDIIVSNNLDSMQGTSLSAWAFRNGLQKETLQLVLDGLKLTSGEQLGPLFFQGSTLEQQLSQGLGQLGSYKTGNAGPLSSLPTQLQPAAVQMSTDLMSTPVKTDNDINNFAQASTQFLSDAREFGTDNTFKLADYILDPVYVRNFKKALESGNPKSRDLVTLTSDYIDRLSVMLSDELSKIEQQDKDTVKFEKDEDGHIQAVSEIKVTVPDGKGGLKEETREDRFTRPPVVQRANKLLDIQKRLTKFGLAFEG